MACFGIVLHHQTSSVSVWWINCPTFLRQSMVNILSNIPPSVYGEYIVQHSPSVYGGYVWWIYSQHSSVSLWWIYCPTILRQSMVDMFGGYIVQHSYVSLWWIYCPTFLRESVVNILLIQSNIFSLFLCKSKASASVQLSSQFAPRKCIISG